MRELIEIYNVEDLERVISIKPTLNQLFKVVYNNQNLTDEFKLLIVEYINNLLEKYPNTNLTALYFNVKDLKVITDDKMKEQGIFSSIGDYIKLLPKDNYYNEQYYKSTVFHELTHATRIIQAYYGTDYRPFFYGFNNKDKYLYIEEALNELFSYSVLKSDIIKSYQASIEYVEILLDAIEEYSLEDYMNKGVAYLIELLYQKTSDKKTADILVMINEIVGKLEKDSPIDIEYYKIVYEYIAKLHLLAKSDNIKRKDDDIKIITSLMSRLSVAHNSLSQSIRIMEILYDYYMENWDKYVLSDSKQKRKKH